MRGRITRTIPALQCPPALGRRSYAENYVRVGLSPTLAHVGLLRRAMRGAFRALLCVAAMGGGAALAHQLHVDHVARGALEPEPTVIEAHVEPELEMLAPPSAIVPASVAPRVAPFEVDLPSAPPVEPPAIDAMRPFGKAVREGMVMTGRTPHRLILFTFDDGPDPRYTPRLLEQLDEADVKAVFFLTANRIAGRNRWERRNQELAREIVRRGHMVGNHTVDHAQLPLLDDAGVIAQVEGAEAIFEQVLGERTWLLRPPGGARSDRVDALLSARGYTQMMWNLGSGDFQVRSADDVLDTWQRVLERREREHGDRGGVVLMHDIHEWSVDAFPRMVSFLRTRNCELLERGEELYDIVDDPAFFFVPRADASPSAKAPVAVLSRTVLEERQRALRAETAQRCARLALAD